MYNNDLSLFKLYIMWTIIENTDNKYSVSEDGYVKNNKTGLILSFDINSKGYRRVAINNKWKLVHRIVAFYYCPNPDMKPQVNHIDEDKTNNHYTNLNWMTNRENTNYSRMKNNKTVITPEMVQFIRANKGKIKAVVMAKRFNIARITIYKILDFSLYPDIPPQNQA